MTAKEFIYIICKDIFTISFISLAVFGIAEWLEPGFVSYYISFVWLLIIPLIFGTVTVILDKNKTQNK
jgi:hypothetical protein